MIDQRKDRSTIFPVWLRILAWSAGLFALAIAYVWWRGMHVPQRFADALNVPQASPSDPAIERGAYLIKVAGCMGCHTAAGGEVLAGGGIVKTPLGTFFAPNLTPDTQTGIGGWSREDFHKAMRLGVAPGGRLLYPAFPYEQYTYLSPEDVDAMYAYLQSLPAVHAPRQAHDIPLGLGSQFALALWRGVYFRSAYELSSAGDKQQERGAYLVTAVTHCAACHAPRNSLGALSGGQLLQGGGLSIEGWMAPSLLDSSQAGVQQWPVEKIVQLLQGGKTMDGVVASGPMADAVFWSTQYLSDEDAVAVAHYLKNLEDRAQVKPSSTVIKNAAGGRGQDVYRQHCAACHGEGGKDAAGIFPPLAGNRAVLAAHPGNMLRSILYGGYAPSVQGQPPSVGMPPFLHVLSDADVAAVATYIRQAWGNQASAVATMEAFQARQER